MDEWFRALSPFPQYFSHIRRWKGEYEGLCAMKRHLGSERISPPARFEPETPKSIIGSTYRTDPQRLQNRSVWYIWFPNDPDHDEHVYIYWTLPSYKWVATKGKASFLQQLSAVTRISGYFSIKTWQGTYTIHSFTQNNQKIHKYFISQLFSFESV